MISRVLSLFFKVILTLLSGFLITILLLFLPFGLLTMVLAIFDPTLALYRQNNSLLIFISIFVFVFLLVSIPNLFILFKAKEFGANKDRYFRINTEKYADDPSGAENINNNPGKLLLSDLAEFSKKNQPEINIAEFIAEDYGWGFWAYREKENPLWLALSYCSGGDSEQREEEYIISVNLEPPLLPWQRIKYKPDFRLKAELENLLIAFFRENKINFSIEEDNF